MENKILLSICIPTYNREKYLIECLNSIVNQEWFNEKIIEVVISDNASEDNTKELVHILSKKYENIIYFRNENNIWFDKNLHNAVLRANWKYCLIIWDDDWFFEWILNKIVSILTTNSNSFYLSNYWWFDTKLKEKVTLGPNLSTDVELINYSSLNEFIKNIYENPINTVAYFWNMSWKIFLRNKWIECLNIESYLWSQVIHLYILLEVMKNEHFWVIWIPIIKSRADNIRWDSFWMTNAIKRELMTLNTFIWIANKYELKISKIRLYGIFTISYFKNFLIKIIKKYLLKDSKQIYKIKLILSKIYFNKNEN